MRLKQICNHPSQWLGDGTYRSSRLECSGRRAPLRRLRCRKAASWSVVRRCAPCAGDLQPGQDRSRMKPCSNSVSAPNMWKTRRCRRLEGVQDHLVAEAVGRHPSPVFEPVRIGDRVGRDCPEIGDTELVARSGVEKVSSIKGASIKKSMRSGQARMSNGAGSWRDARSTKGCRSLVSSSARAFGERQ